MDREVAEVLVRLMAPIAPHFADELWHEALGHTTSVHTESWPEYDPDQAKADEVELAVQVNGKVRAHITVPADAPEDEVRAQALSAAAGALPDKTVVKAIVIPGRLVNVVVK